MERNAHVAEPLRSVINAASETVLRKHAHRIPLDNTRNARWYDAYHAAFREAMTGSEKVWPASGNTRDGYDAEQELAVFVAVGKALRTFPASPESVYSAVMRAVGQIAHDYAVSVADDAVSVK